MKHGSEPRIERRELQPESCVIGAPLLAVASAPRPALFTVGMGSVAVLFFFVKPAYTFREHHERELGRHPVFAMQSSLQS